MLNIATMKRLKYVSNKTMEQGYAEMYLYSEIGFGGIDGAQFAHELMYLTKYHEPPLKKVKVRINSIGGSVMEAFSIFSAIYNANKETDVAVETYNDGVAASSAGFILMAGKTVYAKDYSMMMLHGVSMLNGSGSEQMNLSDNDMEAMKAFKNMIKKVFVSKTDMPEEKVEELLTNGKDNWFTAMEAAEAGFIEKENIENTGLEIDLPAAMGAAKIANRAQKIINKNLKPLKMITVSNLLKLQEGASEQVVANAVKDILAREKQATDALVLAENKIADKDAKIQELQGAVDAAVNTAALTFVDAQLKEGKFAPKNEAEKTALVNQFKANPEGFKTMVAMMPTKAANVMRQIEVGSEEGQKLINKVNGRSFRQLEREDSALLSEIKDKALSLFVDLYNKQYKTERTAEDFK